MARYRAAVLDERKGAALAATIAKIRKAGYEVGTESYKKVPAGVPADHPRAALLRHGGLHAGWEGKPPAVLEKSAFVDFVAKHFAAVAPCTAGSVRRYRQAPTAKFLGSQIDRHRDPEIAARAFDVGVTARACVREPLACGCGNSGAAGSGVAGSGGGGRVAGGRVAGWIGRVDHPPVGSVPAAPPRGAFTSVRDGNDPRLSSRREFRNSRWNRR